MAETTYGTNGAGNLISSVPIGEMVRAMAMAVADAQFGLDKASLMTAEFMSGRRPLREPQTGEYLRDQDGNLRIEPSLVDFGYTIENGKRVPIQVSMLELGFVPTFYQFVDTVIEVKLALRVHQAPPLVDPLTGELQAGSGSAVSLRSTPVDAGYAGGYNFNLELASVFKTKLVCVPPPAALEERLRSLAAGASAAGEAGARSTEP